MRLLACRSLLVAIVLGHASALAAEPGGWGGEFISCSGVTEKGPFSYCITRLVHSSGSCVVLVSEGPGGRTRISSQDGPVMKGQLFAANAREVEYTCDRRIGKAGEFRCAGKSFPLAQGALFLIDLRGGKTVIKQVPVPGSPMAGSGGGCTPCHWRSP